MQHTAVYMDAARDCYEAFVIYNFFMYLLAYLDDEYGDIDAYFSTKEDIPHIWPVQYFLNPWPMGVDFFWQCKKGILNYVILRPLMSAVSLISNAFDSREAGNRGLDFRHPYIYTTIVNNFSQTWALYCLVLMFKATKDELSPIRPFAKFAVVKAVVFFSFWQSVAIQLVAWWKPSFFGGHVSPCSCEFKLDTLQKKLLACPLHNCHFTHRKFPSPALRLWQCCWWFCPLMPC